MPLPNNGTPWPPPSYAKQMDRIEDYDAWYSGDPDRLADAYRRRSGESQPQNRPGQRRGGLVGTLSRWFWGQPTPAGERRSKIHMPLAADIATSSADLLFSKAPTFQFLNPANTEAWDELDDLMRMNSTFYEAAEIVAALGGGFLRVGADPTLWQHPLVSIVHPDNAYPEFKWGRLTAVTFSLVLETTNNTVLRYLERHELVPAEGRTVAVEYHGLYLGSADKLGVRKSLDDHPFTAGMEDEVVHNQPVLPVVHVPNMLPSRQDRSAELGRSDFEGVTHLFDSIDEVATSLLRDVRLGKGRAFIPSAYLQNLGRGQGAAWDPDAEIYQQLDIPPTEGAGITIHQFAIRVDEHVRTMDALVRQATRTAGYSASSFGLESAGGGDVTATEINDRRSRSALTRSKKINYWKESLKQFAEATLYAARDFEQFASVDPTEIAQIEWPEVAETDPLNQAQTILALDSARAISAFLKVKMQHPDWDDTELLEEVERIRNDSSVSDPLQMDLGFEEPEPEPGPETDADQ